jgi:hypothetical protein
LANLEQAIRDPKTGARRARILKRWAERQVGSRSAEVMSRFRKDDEKKDEQIVK